MEKRKALKVVLGLLLVAAMTFTSLFSSYELIISAAPDEQESVIVTEEQAEDQIEAALTQESGGGSNDETAVDVPVLQEQPEAIDEQVLPETEAAKTEYVWEDNKVKVTATLSEAGAIPDDAALVVTAVNNDSEEYSYKGYMDTLNQDEEEYTAENTLLYDIAFIKDKTEVRPSNGTVSVRFEFLDSQLSESIGAGKDANVHVIHLPIRDAEKYDRTADAKDIDVDDIDIEELTEKDNELSVNVEKEIVEFTSADFSVYAFTTIEEGDEFTEDADAMKDSGKTWAEADGKFTIKSSKKAASGPLKAGVNGFADYEPYMTVHTLKQDGNTIRDGSTIDPNSDFQLTLQFALDFDDMVQNGSKYSYRLPANVSVGDVGSPTQQVTLYNSRRVAIGTYYIKDDVMFVTFPGYYDEVVANFSMSASWTGTSGRSEIEVPWNGRTETYLINNCELKIIKNSAGYKTDEDGNLYNHYKVTIKPKEDNLSVGGVTFKDTMSQTHMKLYEDYFGSGKDVVVTIYDGNNRVIDTQYYEANGTSIKTSPVSIDIGTYTIPAGGKILVEYAGKIDKADRLQMDATNQGDNYINTAVASQDWRNPTTGQIEHPSVEAQIKGDYKNESSWVFKEAGDDTKTKNQDGDQVTVVPYTVTINKHRRYSMGGGAVTDAITDFEGGDVRKDVKYDTSGASDVAPYVIATDINGDRTINQTWVILDADTWSELKEITKSTGSLDVTQLDKLNQNPTLVGKLLTAAGKSGSTLTKELAETLIFTSEDAHNFIWFMPKDETPTTYTIYYFTLIGSEVGTFKNSASMWYTLYEGAPGGDGVPIWTRPVQRVMNASKRNEGVYIGADGNYYVDYTITVGVEPGSAAFEDIYIKDIMPQYEVNGTLVGDWIKGLEADSLRFNTDSNGASSEDWRTLNSGWFTVSTESSDPNVKAVVDRTIATLYRASADLGSFSINQHNEDLIRGKLDSIAPYEFYSNSLVYKDTSKKSAGQFYAFKSSGNPSGGVRPIERGDTFTLKYMDFFLGDLPGTDVGYDIDIKYTMQVNPYLIENLADDLEIKEVDYARLQNTALVGTSAISTDGKKKIALSSLTPGSPMFIGQASTEYWIGASKPTDYINKDVNSYDKESRLLLFDVTVNEEGTLDATNNKYVIEDGMNISGVKYKANSMTLTDADGKIIWTNVAGKSADAAYSSLESTYTVSEEDNTVNSFTLVLDNKDGLLTDSNGKLKKIHMEYGVDFTDSDSDVTLMNTVSLRLRSGVTDTDSTYDQLIDEDTSEYSVDKAVDKKMVKSEMPSAANNYTAKYYIIVDPTSTNAYELGDIRAGETFTVKDTLSEALLLNIDDVKVEQTLNGVTTDITSSCTLAYDVNDNVFEATIPVTDPNATYRIDYEAFVLAEAMTVIKFSNTAEISGTHVKPDTVEEKILVFEYDESAAAYTYGIRLMKFDAKDIETKLSAQFDLYEYNTTSKTWDLLTTGIGDAKRISTDSNGYVVISNTLSGTFRYIRKDTWYKLVEAVPPEGYMLDDTPTYYYVSTDAAISGSIPQDNQKELEHYTVLTMPAEGATEQDLPILYVSDSKLEFRVLKTDKATGEPIEGAEFEVYTDPECTQKLDTQTTDADGRIHFENLQVPTTVTLYLKETLTPDNYIPNTDKIYTLNFVDGLLSGDVTDQEGNKLTHTKEGFESLLKVTNTSKTGRLEIRKSVTTDVTANRTRDTFAFVINLTDANDQALTDPVKMITVTADGEETEGTYRSGSIVELKHGEKAILPELPDGTKYDVREVEDNMYSTTVEVTDTLARGGDKKSSHAGYDAQGTVVTGEADTVKYANKLLDTLTVKKQVVADNGDDLKIPDGHTLSIKSKETSTDPYLTAVWNEAAGEYELSTRSSDSYGFYTTTADGEPIEGGFRVTGLPNQTDNTYYIEESHATISGYTYVLTDAKDTNPNVVSVDVKNKDEASKTLINTYTVREDTAEAELRALKMLEGAELEKDQFSFVLYQKVGITGYSKIVQTVKNSKSGRIAFDTLTFDKAGTYYFQIKEVKPANADPDITYQEAPVYVKIVVSKVGDKLQADEPVYSTTEGGEAADPLFINTHITKEITASLQASKKMSGKDAASDAFTLRVKEVEADYTTPVTNTSGDQIQYTKTTPAIDQDDTVTVDFDPMTYAEAGDHYYVISEDIPSGADGDGVLSGIHYDKTLYRAKVSITESQGQLSADISYMDATGAPLDTGKLPQFTNRYEAKGDITFSGTKTIDTRALQEDDIFTFTIKEGGEIVGQAQNNASGVIEYPKIEYILDDEHRTGVVGEHTYTITEENSTVSHVTKSSMTYTVKVNVTDDGEGNLTAVVTEGDKDNLDFINTYEASGAISLKGTKNISGRNFKTGDKWKFNIERDPADEDSADAPLPSVTYVEVEPTTGTSIDFTFGQMIFSAADIGKTYSYIISEDASVKVDGVNNDPNKKVVKVSIADAGKGRLTVTADYGSNEAESAEFTNTYGASNKIELSGSKSLTGRSFKEGDKWKFNVTALTEGAPLPANPSVVIEPTAADGKTKTFSFGDIVFTSEHLGGEKSKTFRYEVSEDAATTVANVTNDPAKKIFEVKVTDDDSGTLQIEQTELSEAIAFTNTYKAEGDVTFEGTKTLEGRPLTANDVFTFTVTENGETVATGTNDSEGKITFSKISYKIEGDTEGVLGEHTYTVSETTPEDTTITSKTRPYTVTVNVTDDGNGNLTATPSENYNQLTFVNAYSASGSIEFNGTKSMEGRKLKSGESYTFAVTETVDGTEKIASTGTSDDTGKITYTPIAYTEQDIGTHTYTVKETSQDTSSVKVDTNSYTVVVEVSDAGGGNLDATVTQGNKDELNFKNRYVASESISFEGLKTISGREYKDGDKWAFTVARDPEDEASKNAPLPDPATVPVEPQSGASHEFTFGSITYTQDDIGKTYKYIITEDPTVKVQGVTNDPNAKAVTVSVTDADEGKLNVTVDYGNDQDKAVFTNTYDASGSQEFKGSKTISGRSFTAGDQWRFDISADDADAPPLEKTSVVINPTAADGQNMEFSLGTFKYTLNDLKGQNSRTFTYTVTENKDVTVAGVTNDTTVRKLKVVVTNQGDGTLDVSVASDSDPITFSNDYEATGDITFGGNKTIDSRNLNDTDIFEFTITDSDGTSQTVRNDATGTIAYPKLEYVLDKDHLGVIGDHTYRVAEKVTSKGGLTKDSREYVVVVSVADNKNGTLDVKTKSVVAENAPQGASEPTEDTLDFVNAYEAKGSYVFAGQKSIDARELKSGETYKFTIQETGLLGIAKGDPVTAESDDTGTINYPALEYVLNKDRDDTGTHTYKVSEEKVDANGIKSSSVTYTVKLKVTDLENGELNVEPVEGSDDPQKLDFENTYVAKGDITFGGKKGIDCRSLNVTGDQDVFEFTITGPDGYSETVKNDADGNIAYPKLEFVLDKDHKDVLGDHTYTVVEKTTTQKGITIDSSEYTVVVNVADNKDGTLAVTAKSVEAATSDTGDDAAQPADGEGDAAALTEKDLNFVNAYEATGEYTFEGRKSIDTRELESGESYQFTVQEIDEAGETIGEALTAVSDDSGSIGYPTLKYELNKDRSDLGIHIYKVTEEAVEADGVTSSEDSYTVRLEVTDLEDSTLKVETAEDSDDPAKLDFENHYAAEGSAQIEVTKQILGRDWKDADAFSFELKALKGAPMPEGTSEGSTSKTVTINKLTTYDGAAYTETFGQINYSMEDLKTNGKYVGEKTFEYEIRELDPQDDEIEYDDNTYRVVVTVTDGKKGTLTTSVKFYQKGTEVAPEGKADTGEACVTARGGLKITNTYSPAKVKTGDNSGIAGWLAVFLMAALTGCASIVVYRRKRSDD